MFEHNNVQNGTILRDVFIFWTQFCETSSFFEVQDIKYERILRDFLQKWKVECRADRLVPMRFAIFPVHLSKVLRLPRKIDARSYEVLHLSRKIILANLHIWYSKMQPLSGNQHPDLLTAPMKMSLVLRLPRKMHLCRSSSHVPRLPSFLEMLQNPHVLLTFDKVHNPLRLPGETRFERPKVVRTWLFFVHFDFEMCFAPQRRALFRHLNFQKWSGPGVFCTFWLRNVLRATTACTFSTSQLPKVVRTWCALYILISKSVSRHNGVHFFDISTAKSGPHLLCFVHFDFEICFAPQRRALFRHLNCQKWSASGVFCTFWFRNLFRATTACTFSTSQLVKVVRSWCVLHILTSKSASRHNGVHFFNISISKSGPNVVRLVHFDLEMCFAPQRRAIAHLSSGQPL